MRQGASSERRRAAGPEAGSRQEDRKKAESGIVCPVCGATCEQIKCKVVCPRCRTLVYNCSEF
jgi:rubrerythrin